MSYINPKMNDDALPITDAINDILGKYCSALREIERLKKDAERGQASSASSGSGAALIAAERQRQMDVEGWTPEHDDEHSQAEISQAAKHYVHEGFIRAKYPYQPREHERFCPTGWPWHQSWWKPSGDPVRNLVKAGALIAAEIDRLQRIQNERDVS